MRDSKPKFPIVLCCRASHQAGIVNNSVNQTVPLVQPLLVLGPRGSHLTSQTPFLGKANDSGSTSRLGSIKIIYEKILKKLEVPMYANAHIIFDDRRETDRWSCYPTWSPT